MKYLYIGLRVQRIKYEYLDVDNLICARTCRIFDFGGSRADDRFYRQICCTIFVSNFAHKRQSGPPLNDAQKMVSKKRPKKIPKKRGKRH